MKVFKHGSDSNPYGYGHYFYNIPDTNAEEIADIVQDALNYHKREAASNILHEIAHCIFVSDDPARIAKIYERAPAMFRLLKQIASAEKICTIREINRLIDNINGKDCD